MGTLLGILGQGVAAYGAGILLGCLASWFGFISLEEFFRHAGSISGCSCLGFLLFGVLTGTSAALFPGPFGTILLALASLGVLFFGFLKGLETNPWRWIGQSQDPEEEKD